MAERTWTVVRFPNGSWSYGGSPNSPDYEQCEVWLIAAPTAKAAVKKAQSKRSREARRADGVADEAHNGGEPSAAEGKAAP